MVLLFAAAAEEATEHVAHGLGRVFSPVRLRFVRLLAHAFVGDLLIGRLENLWIGRQRFMTRLFKPCFIEIPVFFGIFTQKVGVKILKLKV